MDSLVDMDIDVTFNGVKDAIVRLKPDRIKVFAEIQAKRSMAEVATR